MKMINVFLGVMWLVIFIGYCFGSEPHPFVIGVSLLSTSMYFFTELAVNRR